MKSEREAMKDFRREYWRALLKDRRYNITKAAMIAGYNRTHAYKLLKELGLYPMIRRAA